ncbi:MAG: hypothetical protein R3F34_09060 [Planctomycetota bacterium]
MTDADRNRRDAEAIVGDAWECLRPGATPRSEARFPLRADPDDLEGLGAPTPGLEVPGPFHPGDAEPPKGVEDDVIARMDRWFHDLALRRS